MLVRCFGFWGVLVLTPPIPCLWVCFPFRHWQQLPARLTGPELIIASCSLCSAVADLPINRSRLKPSPHDEWMSELHQIHPARLSPLTASSATCYQPATTVEDLACQCIFFPFALQECSQQFAPLRPVLPTIAPLQVRLHLVDSLISTPDHLSIPSGLSHGHPLLTVDYFLLWINQHLESSAIRSDCLPPRRTITILFYNPSL